MSNAKKPEPKASDLPPIEPVIPGRRIRAVSETTSKILGVKTYVLDDGRVVVSATHMQEAFGLARASAPPTDNDVAQVPRFLAAKNLNPFVSAELTAWLKSPITFSLPGGGLAYGYDSDVITDIALAIVKASVKGALYTRQHRMAQAAEAFVAATSKVGSRHALLDEHGMQPRAGAADDLHDRLEGEVKTLRQEVVEERQSRIKALAQVEEHAAALERQVQAGAQMATRIGDLETQIRIIASGALSEVPRAYDWVMTTIRDIGMLRRFADPKLTEAQALGAVREELRRSLKFQHAPMEQFPFGRMGDMRQWLFWMHRDALKGARRHGFGGDGSWTQPPLPFMGLGDDEDCE